jgi:divalent metal cation (Fe/Co/Zn/Cd) transporter
MAVTTDRSWLVQRGRTLEYFTVAYNSAEGLISIIAGVIAGSVSLVAFGLDSLIEVTSGAALLWRLHHDQSESRREAIERTTLRIVGWCFVSLAVYVAFNSGWTLVQHEKPERSIPGIIVAAVSVVVMPLLARAKRRVATGIRSATMKADSRQAATDRSTSSVRQRLVVITLYVLRFREFIDGGGGRVVPRDVQITSNDWTPIEITLPIRPHYESQLAIFDQWVSTAPSSIQLRNLFVAQKK